MLKTRLFVGIEIPQKIKEKLTKIQREILEIEQLIRPVNLKNLHLTLVFLGYLDDMQKNKVEKVLDKIVLNFLSFELNLGNLCFFPNEKQVRVIAIELNNSRGLINLQKKLQDEFKKLKFIKIEKREYKPHLTILRTKNLRLKNIDKIKNIKISGEKFRIESLKLFKSVLKRKGAEHSVLKEWKLK